MHAREMNGLLMRNTHPTAHVFCFPRRSLTLSLTEHVSPTELASTSQTWALGTLPMRILSVTFPKQNLARHLSQTTVKPEPCAFRTCLIKCLLYRPADSSHCLIFLKAIARVSQTVTDGICMTLFESRVCIWFVLLFAVAKLERELFLMVLWSQTWLDRND